jgi:glycosyltransferase involved in cell wall biosynthesis
VLSSRYEGMPTALLQAMALGTPAVSTDCPGGSRDALANGAYGALVPAGDTGKLAAAIASGVDSPRRPDVARHIAARFGAREATVAYLKLVRDR